MLVSFMNILLTNLRCGTVSGSLVNHIQHLSHSAVAGGLVSYINTSLTNPCYGTVSAV